MLLKVRIDDSKPQYFTSTEVDRNIPLRQVSSGTQVPQAETHGGKNKLERDFPISKHHLISQREN